MKILIVEDDASIRFGLEEVLSAEGYQTAACERGDGVVDRTVTSFAPDLIVMDVMMPGRNGFDCCRDLRAAGVRVPILMLTAKGQERDKVIGLECGADDYVTKPFSLPELTARIHALLRRAGEFSTAPDGAAASFRVGASLVDPSNHAIRREGDDISLSPRECSLLVHLYRHRGRVLTRDQLLESVWGMNAAAVTTRTLDQTVAQLRKKLGDAASSPRWLITVHGVGYRLEN
jgi:DNA-binding response OmpR family regulator